MDRFGLWASIRLCNKWTRYASGQDSKIGFVSHIEWRQYGLVSSLVVVVDHQVPILLIAFRSYEVQVHNSPFPSARHWIEWCFRPTGCCSAPCVIELSMSIRHHRVIRLSSTSLTWLGAPYSISVPVLALCPSFHLSILHLHNFASSVIVVVFKDIPLGGF